MNKTTEPAALAGIEPEQVQWRNIRHVVRTLADWAFGSKDDPKWGVAWISIVNGLTAKDGPVFKLEPLSAATVEQLVQERNELLRRKFDVITKNADMTTRIAAMTHELASAKEAADYAWKNTRAIDKSRIETEEQLAAMTQERDELREQITEVPQIIRQLSASQAREQQLREALVASDELLRELPSSGGFVGLAIMENNSEALSLPQDDTALRQWGAELLREIVPQMEYNGCGWTSEHELRRKADELLAGDNKCVS